MVDPDIIGIREKPFSTSVAIMQKGEEQHNQQLFDVFLSPFILEIGEVWVERREDN